MLLAYVESADAFTTTAEERADVPLAWWAQRIAAPSGLTASFGAFDADRLLGTVALEYASKPKTCHTALLIGMYVHPDARGRGAGALLLQAAIDAARQRPGLQSLKLTVTEGNAAAIALYQRAGFIAWGTEPEAIRTPGGLRGKVHMAMKLSGSPGDLRKRPA